MEKTTSIFDLADQVVIGRQFAPRADANRFYRLVFGCEKKDGRSEDRAKDRGKNKVAFRSAKVAHLAERTTSKHGSYSSHHPKHVVHDWYDVTLFPEICPLSLPHGHEFATVTR